MEILILICLLLVIALLVEDKIVIHKTKEQKTTKENNPNLPDIMGQPKPAQRLLVPYTANDSQKKMTEKETDNFDTEIDKIEVDIQIPQEDLDEAFSQIPDFEEEEEEWYRYGIVAGVESLAQGVTFDELSFFGALLQKETIEKVQKDTAITIVQKLQGTELFSLLENSIEGASRKIALLLDSSLAETDSGSSSLRKNDWSDFDIGEFV